jgi:hypothetical protein
MLSEHDHIHTISNHRCWLALPLVLALCLSLVGVALSQQSDPPIKLDVLLETVRNVAALRRTLIPEATRRLVREIKRRGVDFQMSPADELRLRAAGGRPLVIDAVRANFRPLTTPTPILTPPPAPTSTPTPTPTPTDRGYHKLIEQATAELRKSNADEAVRLLREAVKLDPSERDAYQLLGSTLLYQKGQFDGIGDVMFKTLQRDGVVVFRLSHDHSNGTFQSRCVGNLTLAKNVVSFVADDNIDKFRVGYGDIVELKLSGARPNSFTLKLAQAGGRALEYRFSTAAPLTATGGQKFEASGVAPALRDQLYIDEARLIVQLINIPQH